MEDVETVMRELAATGASVLFKCDGERLPENRNVWTVVVTGGPLTMDGPIRHDDETLEKCVRYVVQRLRDRGYGRRGLDDLLG